MFVKHNIWPRHNGTYRMTCISPAKTHSACASAQIDQRLRCSSDIWILGKLQNAYSEDSAQTSRLRRLIGVFAVCTYALSG